MRPSGNGGCAYRANARCPRRGNSCNVGTAYPIGIYVNPDHVGVDIGCTISMHRLSCGVNPDDFPLLDHRIREAIPTGKEICPKNSLNEKELFRFLNSQYQKARSAAPDLINEAPRIDARFITDFCHRIKLQEGCSTKASAHSGRQSFHRIWRRHRIGRRMADNTLWVSKSWSQSSQSLA